MLLRCDVHGYSTESEIDCWSNKVNKVHQNSKYDIEYVIEKIELTDDDVISVKNIIEMVIFNE